MSSVALALHRAILCVDVQGFGDRRRTNLHQVTVRDGLYRSLRDAFTRSGVEWDACHSEDRGDGILLLVPPDIPKNLLVRKVPRHLAAALYEHNLTHDINAQIRLRMVVHAGEVVSDAHGVAGTAINVAFRLLEAGELKRALEVSSGVLAMIASEWFYDEVIRHDPESVPVEYRKVRVSVKETQTSAWIWLPGEPCTEGRPTPSPSLPTLVVPRQLPGAIASFAGRTSELHALTTMLDRDMVPGGTVVISAIDGTAGIGKTAFALHWAHDDHSWAEQVKLDSSGDVGDAWLAGFSGGEVAGFLGSAGAVAVRAVADGGAGHEYSEQERGEGEIQLVRGGKPRRCPSRLPGRAGS